MSAYSEVWDILHLEKSSQFDWEWVAAFDYWDSGDCSEAGLFLVYSMYLIENSMEKEGVYSTYKDSPEVGKYLSKLKEMWEGE